MRWSSPHPFSLGPPATDTLSCFLLFLTYAKVYELFPLPGTASSNFCPHPTLLILEASAYIPERTDPTDLCSGNFFNFPSPNLFVFFLATLKIYCNEFVFMFGVSKPKLGLSAWRAELFTFA